MSGTNGGKSFTEGNVHSFIGLAFDTAEVGDTYSTVQLP
jgi:hypothetical protein